MKTTLLTLLAAFGVLAGASAQNLIVNGDFETGQLTPWTGGTIAADPAGGFFATTASTLSQTVPTTVGTKYLFSGMIRVNGSLLLSINLIAGPAAGGASDGIRSVSSTLFTTGFFRGSLVFTASSASTKLSFLFSPFPGSTDTITIDNAELIEVEPTKFAGRYAGGVVTTLSLTDLELSNKSSRKITARITEDNLIYILDGTQAIFSGVILNDGTFDLSGQLLPSAFGKGKIRGKRIELEFSGAALFASEPSGMPIPNTVRNRINLTRR